MNTAVVIEVRHRGADGKLYRDCPLPAAELDRARSLAHNLVHRDGLSIRQAQRVMAESYGLRRSVGVIAADLRVWACARCRDE